MFEEELKNRAFKKLQPICVKISRNCLIEDIDKLSSLINEIDKKALCYLQGYIIFPLRMELSKGQNEKIIIRIIDFLSHLFDVSEITCTSTFTSIFYQLVNMITNLEDPDSASNASEELKSSVCHCVISMVKNADDDVLYDMYDEPFKLTLAQAFYVLVALLKRERSKSLRQTLLITIGTLTYNTTYQQWRSEIIEAQASKSLTHYFPGLTGALRNVACGDMKQGQNVIKMAIHIFSQLIVLVASDKYFMECNNIKNNCLEETSSNESQVPSNKKDQKWFENASSEIKPIIANLTVLVSHDQWKVRLELLNFADSVLCKCMLTFESCVPILLPAVFALSVDSYPEISSHALDVVRKFSEKFQSSNSIALYTIIQDDLHIATSKLIRCKLTANDAVKLSVLRTINGYLEVFGNSVGNVLFSLPHLEKIILSLINILEFDINIGNLVEDISLFDIQDTSHTQCDKPLADMWPRKRFSYFQNEEILNTICNICYKLGQHANIRILIEYLIEKLHSSQLLELQCIFLIGRILEGVVNQKLLNEEKISLVEDIISELFSLEVLDNQNCSPTNFVDEKICSSVDVTSTEMLSNYKIYQVCLSLETLSKCAKVLQTNFKILLIKVLFFVMEHAGSNNTLISQSGKSCLVHIAHYCEYSSVFELIKENADYIVNSITINFHHFLHRPQMAVVLRVVMEESSPEILPLFKDAIFQVLNLLDFNQNKSYILLKVLCSVINSVKRWFLSKKPASEEYYSIHGKNLKESLIEFKSLKKTEMEEFEREIDTEEVQTSEDYPQDNTTSDAENDYRAPPPLHVTITTEVLKRCGNLQISKNRHIQVLSLEIIEACILVLRDFDVQLHPIIHELWNLFVGRFSDETIVCLRAFKVLLLIADTCGDFVYRRVQKQIGNKLLSILKNGFSCSSSKSNFRNYQWQNACKLQLYVLSEIGSLYAKLNASEKDIAQLAEVCLPYLHKSQPRVFQEAAFKTMNALAVIDPDSTWLYYNELYCDHQILLPPDEQLDRLHFPNSSPTDFKFAH